MIGKDSAKDNATINKKHKYKILDNKENKMSEDGRSMTRSTKKLFLEPNHSYFILVDNGTNEKTSTECDLRARLEDALDKLWENVPSMANALHDTESPRESD